MRNIKKQALFAIVAIGMMYSTGAKADSVTLTLTQATEYVSAQAGGTVTFDATVFAPTSNSADVYLNGDSFDLSAPLTLDDTDFFLNFPLDLAPGDSFTGDLFTVTVPAGVAVEDYQGSFTLQGGGDGNTYNDLATVSFDVVATPEPSSILLLITGLIAMAFAFQRRGLIVS
ncbi:MAG: PEP-CTERM sorting domain-containing protein [Terracidiphilus sp.]|nr:PEP-CTERM sorting domain-containing protein [Terracidiphilus sp.]MDR3798108.1 PEP-CTERM sorting domain-containing protein [Terracidiphilus sp.]